MQTLNSYASFRICINYYCFHWWKLENRKIGVQICIYPVFISYQHCTSLFIWLKVLKGVWPFRSCIISVLMTEANDPFDWLWIITVISLLVRFFLCSLCQGLSNLNTNCISCSRMRLPSFLESHLIRKRIEIVRQVDRTSSHTMVTPYQMQQKCRSLIKTSLGYRSA